MADKPILFSAPMVRALLGGTKTQTRRILKPQPSEGYDRMIGYIGVGCTKAVFADANDATFESAIRISAGDRLWVRETWSGVHDFGETPPSERQSYTTPVGPVLRDEIWYWADGNPDFGDWEKPRPGIHMPRWASRLTLIVTNVRVERLQDCSETDAIAEGIRRIGAEFIARGSTAFNGPNFYTVDMGFGNFNDVTAVDVYRGLWEWINGEGAWEANPWVVAYTFTVMRGNIDQIGGE